MRILAKIFPLNENGAGDDYEKFTSFWSQVEGCEVEKIDMKYYTPPRIAEDFEKQLKDFREKFEKGKYKYLVLAVSSHGMEEEQATDGKEVTFKIVLRKPVTNKQETKSYKVNELLDIFKEVKEKQKIFIMQMCRNRSDGTTVTLLGKDQGVMHHSNTVPAISNQQTSEELLAGAHGKSMSSGALDRVAWPKTWKLAQPCIRDSIVMFSSPSGLDSDTPLT